MPRKQGSDGSLSKSPAKPQVWLGQWHVWIDGQRKHRGPKVVTDKDGQELLCSKVGKKTAQDCLRRMVAADREAAGIVAPVSIHTFQSEWDRYVRNHQSGWERATKDNLTWIFSKHVLHVPVKLVQDDGGAQTVELGSIPIKELTRDILQAHIDALAEAKRSRSMISKVRTYFHAVLDDAIEADRLTKNPARKLALPKFAKAVSKPFLSPEECEMLLAKSIEEGRSREHLILRMCMSLGPRRGEVFALRRNDVEKGRIRVDESAQWDAAVKDPKTGASNAWLPLPESLEVEIRSWMAANPGEPDGYLFSQVGYKKDSAGVRRRTKVLQPYRPPNYLRRVLKPLADRAGVATVVNFQTLRRTTATWGATHGSQKDLQGLMRHSNAAMTMGVYAQVIQAGVRATANAVDDELCGGLVQ